MKTEGLFQRKLDRQVWVEVLNKKQCIMSTVRGLARMKSLGHSGGHASVHCGQRIIFLCQQGPRVKFLKTNISHYICARCAALAHQRVGLSVKLAVSRSRWEQLGLTSPPPSAMCCHISEALNFSSIISAPSPCAFSSPFIGAVVYTLYFIRPCSF